MERIIYEDDFSKFDQQIQEQERDELAEDVVREKATLKRRKRWDEMTDEEQEQYQKEKQATDDAYNRIANNLNAGYRNPSRYVTRHTRTFSKNIYKRLSKKGLK